MLLINKENKDMRKKKLIKRREFEEYLSEQIEI